MDNSFHPQLSVSHWMFDLKLLPTIYHQIIGAVTSSLGLDSSLIYKVFLSSGLNQPILQHIWSTTSQSHPGWFTPAELVSALALIGLAQAEQVNRSHTSLETLLHSLSLKRLHTLPYPPIPQVQLPVEQPMVELRTTNQTNVGSISCIPLDYPTVTSYAIKKQPQATWPFSALPDYERNSFSIETKSTVILSDPSEDEWADFTSCKPPVNEDICRPADPLNTIKCDFEWPAREHTKPPRLPDNRDDDFGEFQTISKQVESDQNSTKTAQVPDPTRTSVPLPLRPNYNVSVDPSSEMTPLESVQHEWLRCVVQCAELMRDSLDALQLISTDAEKTEFNETEEGVEFFSGE
ncbi:hypothetical protein D915_010721 [Fasciola hepatica]|uniref:EH domain-containing protein n=1 Tax=Fasciola hepatica TaxID=6192 RepID=A0A4E0QZA0_FASHE|nr:hypothetical protein D915_010721 [Fasciola hepatica]